jgi:hypothetical protein
LKGSNKEANVMFVDLVKVFDSVNG